MFRPTLFSQVDDDGNRQVLLDEMIDQRTNGSQVLQQDAYITTTSGTRRRRETTVGWELLAQWKDGSSNWIALKDIKESYPVQVAEYAVGARISMEPTLTWWVPYRLHHQSVLAFYMSKSLASSTVLGICIPNLWVCIQYFNFTFAMILFLFFNVGQCTEALKERLKVHEVFVSANQNGIPLLILICSLLHTFEERHKLADILSDVKMAFYKLCQGKYMKLEWYHENFLAQVEVLDEVGVTIPDSTLIQHIADQYSTRVPIAADHEEAKQIALAIQFIKGTNACHKPYLSHLHNSCLDGSDVYANTVQEAYNILQQREEVHNVPMYFCFRMLARS